jgi:hypothetical protein
VNGLQTALDAKASRSGANFTGDIIMNNNGYGRIMGSDQYHAVILRGDISSYTAPNYSVGNNDAITFIEFSGIFRFRQTNATNNTLLFEISPTDIKYKGTPLATKPQYAARFKYNGTTLEYLQSHGAVTVTSSMLSRISLGNYRIVLQPGTATNAGVIATANTLGNRVVSGEVINNNEIYLMGVHNGSVSDFEICFMTVP